MKTAANRAGRIVGLLALASGLMLATAGIASAQAVITGTEVSPFSESFADEPFLCQEELYAQTVSGHSVVHFTYDPDTGAFHFHQDVHGQVVAVPLDGTGPTYTGNFWFSDTESIRSVKSGDLLVEQDTDSITSSHADRMGRGCSTPSMRTSP